MELLSNYDPNILENLVLKSQYALISEMGYNFYKANSLYDMIQEKENLQVGDSIIIQKIGGSYNFLTDLFNLRDIGASTRMELPRNDLYLGIGKSARVMIGANIDAWIQCIESKDGLDFALSNFHINHYGEGGTGVKATDRDWVRRPASNYA